MILSFGVLASLTPAYGEEISPTKGIIPAVSDHYKTLPSLYDLNKMPAQHVNDKADLRFIMGTNSTLLKWELKAGNHFPVHYHPNEQMNIVFSGQLKAYSQGKEYFINPGQVMVVPPNVPHEFIATKDTVMYGIQTPQRQDFLNPAIIVAGE